MIHDTAFSVLGFLGQLATGPMVGYATQQEVAIWVQTEGAARLAVAYWPEAEPTRRETSPAVTTERADDFAAHIVIDGLPPGTRFGYEITVDGRAQVPRAKQRFQTQAAWHRRAPPPDFSVAIGSCLFINDARVDPAEPYGGDYQILTSLAAQSPDLMLWLGDNVYFRPGDSASERGMSNRYRHDRSTPEVFAILAGSSNYAIWDDHDYGADNSDRSFSQKGASLRVFRRYWQNPSYGLPELPGIFGQFSWSDVDFFLVDDRTYRWPTESPRVAQKTMLGEGQRAWLLDALSSSEATFKVVAGGGQFLNPLDRWETFADFPDEQRAVLDEIGRRRIEGVVFLSGDRHHTELLRIDREGHYPLYDFTSSPLTARASDADGQLQHPQRVEGTLVKDQRNFGMLRFGGPPEARELTMETYDVAGKRLWQHVIAHKSLRY